MKNIKTNHNQYVKKITGENMILNRKSSSTTFP